MSTRLSAFRRRWKQSRLRARLEEGRANLASAPLGTPYEDDNVPGMGRKRRHVFQSGLALVTLSLVASLITYLIFTGLTPIVPTHNVVVTSLLINAALVLALVFLVAWQIFGLWRARKTQQAGAGLHVRMVSLFMVVATFPAILLGVFAPISIDRGMDQIAQRSKGIIKESQTIASSYIKENGQIVRAIGLSLVKELEFNSQLIVDNPEAFRTLATALALQQRIPFAYLVNSDGAAVTQLANTGAEFAPPPDELLADAKRGEFAGGTAFSGPNEGYNGIKKLENFDNLFLYIRYPMNPMIKAAYQRAEQNMLEFNAMEARRWGMQMAFAMMYGVITLTLLLASIWIGLSFANKLVTPIRRLIGAAQDVSHGDLNVNVKVESPRSDMGRLSATFNQMTTELRNQRNALIGANAKLDERRRFTEAVLSGVTAGVIGVDANGVITLVNTSATQLLGRGENELIGHPIDTAVPELAAIAAKAPKYSRRAVQSQITYRRDGSDLTLSVRVTQEGADKQNYGFVVTFDDITELVVAQRTTAWADIARRIAHEIKNPLTPIQLSAERIRRKYGAHITTDREIFDRCTDTIIRHVGDIGRMVDEFSSFARMPNAVFEHHDICGIVREAVILFQMSNSDISYDIQVLDAPFIIECDRRLLTQAVTNLVKNAGEAIASAVGSGKKEAGYRGHITARVRTQGSRVIVEVIDNGCGLPVENRHRLTEPYVTTRQKGTGLGLAIVQRIAEQHEGVLELDDAYGPAGEVKGAVVRLVIPVAKGAETAEAAVVEVPGQRDGAVADEHGKRLNGGKEGVSYGV